MCVCVYCICIDSVFVCVCVCERERARERDRERERASERESERESERARERETRNTDLSEKLGNISMSVEPRQLCFFFHTRTLIYTCMHTKGEYRSKLVYSVS